MVYIAFDAYEHYTLASVKRPEGRLVREVRISHKRGALRRVRRGASIDRAVSGY